MRFKSASGKLVWINEHKYLIDWDKKSRSKFQFKVKQFLKEYWSNCVVLEEFKIPGARLFCDFVNLNKKIVIEANGGQHYTFNKFFHNKSRINYWNSMRRDVRKEDWAVDNGFQFLEICEEDPLSRGFFSEKFGLWL